MEKSTVKLRLLTLFVGYGYAVGATYGQGIALNEVDETHELAVWSGVNFNAISSDATTRADGMAGKGAYIAPAFGAELWYVHDRLSLGANMAWLEAYSNTAAANGAGQTSTVRFAYLPTTFAAKYYLLNSWYAGAGIGFAPIFSRVDSLTGGA